MRKTDLEDIRALLHEVRAKRFPHVEAQFLDAVLDAEANDSENDTGVLRAIRAALGTTLAKTGED